MKANLFKLIVLLGLAACAADPTRMDGDFAPTSVRASVRPPPDEPFRLAPAEIAAVAEGALLVRFQGISSDSRCPIDAPCVWAGDAEAGIEVAAPGARWSRHTLHANGEPRSVRVGDLEISLLAVEPSRRAEQIIESDEYRVVLRVSIRE